MLKLLVVVDYQNDFVNGSLGFPGAELLDEKIVKKIKEYSGKDCKVYYTLDTHNSGYLRQREGKQLPVEHCAKATPGWKVFGKTKEALEKANSSGIMKGTFGISPFDMASQLFPKAEDVESVEFVGLVTNMCVISNVVIFQARYPEAQMIVDPELCASFDKKLHQAAIDVMCGMQVKIIEHEPVKVSNVPGSVSEYLDMLRPGGYLFPHSPAYHNSGMTETMCEELVRDGVLIKEYICEHYCTSSAKSRVLSFTPEEYFALEERVISEGCKLKDPVTAFCPKCDEEVVIAELFDLQQMVVSYRKK